MEESSKAYVHSISGAGRLLPSAGRWNSIEVDFGLIPTSSYSKEASPLMYTKSYDFRLSVQDKSHLKRFIYIVISLILVAAAAALLTALLPRKHAGGGSLSGLPLALDNALLFFDAQKCTTSPSSSIINLYFQQSIYVVKPAAGFLPKSNPVKFRGNSGLHDGEWKQDNTSLVGGFYDSGNNIKFSFTTAYAITLLSWTVIEYSHKYAAFGQLEHVMDIIKWGSDYLLKLLITSTSSSEPESLFSQESICISRDHFIEYPTLGESMDELINCMS